MLPSSVTLSYSGRNFTIAEDADRVLKGRLACDCTRSLLIREYCDHAFPALKCGHQIVLVSLEETQAPAWVCETIDGATLPRGRGSEIAPPFDGVTEPRPQGRLHS
jgi:hypothetical protein